MWWPPPTEDRWAGHSRRRLGSALGAGSSTSLGSVRSSSNQTKVCLVWWIHNLFLYMILFHLGNLACVTTIHLCDWWICWISHFKNFVSHWLFELAICDMWVTNFVSFLPDHESCRHQIFKNDETLKLNSGSLRVICSHQEVNKELIVLQLVALPPSMH